ncbi:hypothetical protein LLG95_17695 [bacterium]|nr:hypothetical protein [bacterium]
MTKLLSEAFEKASALSEEMQNQLARELLEELEGEHRWDKTLADSHDALDRMADEAEKEFRAGKTKEMGFDEL